MRRIGRKTTRSAAPRWRTPLVGLLCLLLGLVVACTSTGQASTGQANGGSDVTQSAGGNPHITSDNPPEPGDVYGDSNATYSNPDGECVILQFNGADQNHGRKVEFVGMPGTTIHYGSSIRLLSIPGCDSTRDFIVGSGLIQNAVGENVWDRKQPAPGDAPAYTSNHTPVWVAFRADWEMNLSEAALKSFWLHVCVKFACADSVDHPDNPPDLGATSSRPEWLRWQGEDLGPAIDSLVANLMNKYSDSIIYDASKQAALADDISKGFADAFSHATGQSLPVLCGTGSFWKDIQKDDYYCAPVTIWNIRIIPDSTIPFELGPDLGRQVAACKILGPQCTMNMGTGGVTIKTKAKVVGNGTRHSLATAA